VKVARASSGMGMPTVLIDLITIYDDEEGSEASRITPVPITQEEEPGETSAPASDVLIPNPRKATMRLGTLWTLNFSINWEHNLRMTAPRMTWVLVNKKKKCNSQKSTSQWPNPQLMSILCLLPHLGPRLHQPTSTSRRPSHQNIHKFPLPRN
jgi:hypothetical protein